VSLDGAKVGVLASGFGDDGGSFGGAEDFGIEEGIEGELAWFGDGTQGLEEFVASDSDAAESGAVELIEDASGLEEAFGIAFYAEPAVAGGEANIEGFFEDLEEAKIIAVEGLENASVLELEGLWFDHHGD